MIDVLQKLREIAETKPELVKDALENVEKTNPKTVTEGGMKDFLHDEAEKLSREEFLKKHGESLAGFYDAINGTEESAVREDNMRDLAIHDIEAQLGKINDEITFLQIDQKDKESALAALGELRSVLDKYQSQQESAVREDSGKPDFLDMDKDGDKTEPMKKAIKDKEAKKESVKESIQISADTPQEASMMMQLLKLAGVQPVDQAMISQGEPEAEPEANHDDEMGSQEMGRMRDMMTAPAEEKQAETFDNEPEEKVQDIDSLVNKHSGGLNRKKQAFAKAQDGDNAMAVEDTITAEDLTNSLRAQYEGFKEAYQKEARIAEAKPDFLDMDKDGDKKEPMKKAIKDKEAKTEAKDEKCEKCGKMHLTASSCGGRH